MLLRALPQTRLKKRSLLTKSGPVGLAAILYLILPLFFIGQSSATVLEVGPKQDSYKLGLFLDILEDPDREFSFSDIRSEPVSSSFFHSSDENLAFGFTSSAYWLRFSLKNTQNVSAEYFLRLEYPMIDKVDFYVPDSSGGYSVAQWGDHFPFGDRTIHDSGFIFPVKLGPLTEKTFYMRAETTSSMNLPLVLLTSSTLPDYIGTEKLFFGIYFGILFVMMVHNFFIYLSVRDTTYLLYVLFVTFYLLFQFSLNGMTFQYCWSNMLWWANNCVPFFIFAAYFFGAQFTRKVLNSRLYTPSLDKILIWQVRLGFAGVCISLFVEYSLSIKLATFLAATVPTLVLCGILCMMKGYRPARYYLVGWTFSLAGIIVFCLKTFGLVPHTFFTHWGIQIGSAWEVILFSMGLADRFHLMKKEKEELARQHAETLEDANLQLNTTVHKLSTEVSERVRIAKLLEESEQTARAILNMPLNFGALLDTKGNILDVNSTLAANLGAEPHELIGKEIGALFGDGKVEQSRRVHFIKAVESGELVRYEDNRLGYYFDTVLSPIRDTDGMVSKVAVLARDVTKKKIAEKKRREIELKAIAQSKLASLGEIATGMAHEINQPLSYIKIIFESTLRDLRKNQFDPEEFDEDAQESLRQIARITTIISHLRSFGRADQVEFLPVSMANIFDNAMILMGERVKLNNITLIRDVADGLPQVNGNAVKLEQVLINLLQNSCDAIADSAGDEGQIVVKMYAKGGSVVVDFSDNGIGVGDHEDKIFQPFFSTKDVDKGTGLGLSIVYGLVKEHDGTIECRPGVEQGTSFIITLPAI